MLFEYPNPDTGVWLCFNIFRVQYNLSISEGLESNLTWRIHTEGAAKIISRHLTFELNCVKFSLNVIINEIRCISVIFDKLEVSYFVDLLPLAIKFITQHVILSQMLLRYFKNFESG